MKIIAEPIDALVLFRGKDIPKPYKFRYEEKNGTLREIRIDKILQTEEVKPAGIKALVYRCQSEVNGAALLYELKYLIGECRWELYKM